MCSASPSGRKPGKRLSTTFVGNRKLRGLLVREREVKEDKNGGKESKL